MKDIYQYINSINKSEKICFKHYCNKKSKKQSAYEKLFDIINGEKIIDEDQLISYLKINDLEFKNLSKTKNELFFHINKALSSGNLNSSMTSKILSHLIEIEQYYHQSLYSKMYTLIQKTEKLALEYSLFNHLFLIYDWAKIYFITSKSTIELISDENELIIIQNELLELNSLYKDVMGYRDLVQKPRDNEFILRIKDWKLKLKKYEDLFFHSLLARKRYFEIEALIYYLQNEAQLEFHSIEKALEVILKIPMYKEIHTFEYIHLLSRKLILSKKFNIEEYFSLKKNLLEDSENVIQFNKNIGIRILKFVHHTELIRLIDIKDFVNAEKNIDAIQTMLSDHDDLINDNEKISFTYLFLYIKIALGKFSEALKMVTVINNRFKKNDRPDLYGFNQLLLLLVHYELGNHLLLNYLGRSAYYYLKTYKRIYKSEKILISFFKKISKKLAPDEERVILLNHESKFKKSIENEFEKRILGYFNFELWFKAKSNNLSMQECFILNLQNQ